MKGTSADALAKVLANLPTPVLDAVVGQVAALDVEIPPNLSRWSDDEWRQSIVSERAAYAAHRLGAALMLDGFKHQSAGSGDLRLDAEVTVSRLITDMALERPREESFRRQVLKKPQFTYIFQRGPWVKIGRTYDVATRLRALRDYPTSVVCPEDMDPAEQLVLVDYNPGDFERAMHEHFAASRVAGEWFEEEAVLSNLPVWWSVIGQPA